MTITTTQKIIKIGTSLGVTLPAKQLKAMGLTSGDELILNIKPVPKNSDVMDDYAQFKAQYGETLKNLAGR